MRGNKLVGDIYLEEGLFDDITGFIIHYMDLGIMSSSCEYVNKFFYPFVDACA